VPEDIREFIQQLENNPVGLKQLQIESFPQFIDFEAEQGVEIGRVGSEMNLGYAGTYIYWAVEMLIVAIIAYLIMKSTAEEPYCAHCSSWKNEQTYGPYKKSDKIINQLQQGQAPNSKLKSALAAVTNPDISIKMHTCPNCENESEIDVSVQQLVKDKEGNVSEKVLTKMTYPPEAFVFLHAHCAKSVADDETMQQPAARISPHDEEVAETDEHSEP